MALYVATLGGRARRIAKAPEIRSVSPSPSGGRIAYAAFDSLVVAKDNGRRLRTFPLSGGRVFGPIFWSHDGASLFFVRESLSRALERDRPEGSAIVRRP